ncbi:MAG TPA: NACHT domain-containing protein [Azospirillum sp.]|nr:NACHT domain-containing protein [Azospirillum sp.]
MAIDPLATGLTVAAASPLIKGVIEKHVFTKIDKWLERASTQKKLVQHGFVNKLAEHLEQMYAKHTYIKTIALQEQKTKLSDIYIPLTVTAKLYNPSTKSTSTVIYTLDHTPFNLVDEHEKIMIIDSAGMGKSTIAKHMFISCVDNNYAIPVLIELRKVKAGRGIVEYIISEFNSIQEKADPDFILSLIARGDFLFIFDGYDEISTSDKESVVSDIHNFVAKAGKNKYILTSREDPSLTSFSGFQNFRVRPLEAADAYDLIRKYDRTGAVAEQLISELDNPQLVAVQEFLRNPLLTSLLYRAYSYKQTVPVKKPTFYRQVFDALYNFHDVTKEGAYIREKKSKLEIEDFHRALRAVGFLSMRSGKVEYSRDEIIRIIQDAKKTLRWRAIY